jgi:hypothetical protein
MRARVSRYLDLANGPGVDDSVIDGYLADGLRSLTGDLLRDSRGPALLRLYSAPAELSAPDESEPELFNLPDDCRQLLGVQVRASSSDRWSRLPMARPDGRLSTQSGTSHLFGAVSALDGALCYSDADTEPGEIRIWPLSGPRKDLSYRFRYAGVIEFPALAAGSYVDPAATGSVTRWLPVECAEATEFYATALLAGEELENQTPIGHYGQLYGSTVAAILASGNPVRPQTGNIRVGRSR